VGTIGRQRVARRALLVEYAPAGGSISLSECRRRRKAYEADSQRAKDASFHQTLFHASYFNPNSSRDS
jgi:hypothetical protein